LRPDRASDVESVEDAALFRRGLPEILYGPCRRASSDGASAWGSAAVNHVYSGSGNFSHSERGSS
jgi:hypothetical protein